MTTQVLVQRVVQELTQVEEAITQTQRLIQKLPETQDGDMQTALIALFQTTALAWVASFKATNNGVENIQIQKTGSEIPLGMPQSSRCSRSTRESTGCFYNRPLIQNQQRGKVQLNSGSTKINPVNALSDCQWSWFA